ncbi:hypothetical protein E2C01_002048 [Portunus trituberculatus]|uniref:Uncharacterized protein n=1 Tax=Portunus trituberculatus TaxID=210409 RepID=A0A5B7CM02_PORTR|nr:hypothetical protein [Portunus trituberculatus]
MVCTCWYIHIFENLRSRSQELKPINVLWSTAEKLVELLADEVPADVSPNTCLSRPSDLHIILLNVHVHNLDSSRQHTFTCRTLTWATDSRGQGLTQITASREQQGTMASIPSLVAANCCLKHSCWAGSAETARIPEESSCVKSGSTMPWPMVFMCSREAGMHVITPTVYPPG